MQHQVELTMTPVVFNPRHHGQKGTKRTALQALAETVGVELRARGMLSGAPTPCMSRVIAPVPQVKHTVGGHQCTLDHTFAMRGPVRAALPDFNFEKTDRKAQWSAAGFNSVNGIPQKEVVKADAKDLDMSGEEGSATGDHAETELFLPRCVSVTLYTLEGTTHSQLYIADEPLGPLFQFCCAQARLLVAETLFHVDGHPVNTDATPHSFCVDCMYPLCIQVTSRLEQGARSPDRDHQPSA